MNRRATTDTVIYCMKQLGQVINMMPPPHGSLRRDEGKTFDVKAFAEIGKSVPDKVPIDCWANTRVPHKTSPRDPHANKRKLDKKHADRSPEETDMEASHMYSKGNHRSRGKQFALRRQGTQIMGQPSAAELKKIMEEENLARTFRKLDKAKVGTITVDMLFDFMNMQVEEARLPIQQLKALLMEEGYVETHGKNNEVHGWTTIEKSNFVKFILAQVAKNPTATFDVEPLDDDDYSNAEAAAELHTILKTMAEAEAKKTKKVKVPKRDEGSKNTQRGEPTEAEKEKLPDFVQVIAKWPRKRREPSMEKRPSTAVGFENSLSAIDKRLGRQTTRAAFQEDLYMQNSIIDCGVSVYSGVTLREVDKKASALKPKRTVNGLDWPEESPHMSRAKYERLRQGLPDTAPADVGKEASILSEKSGASGTSRPTMPESTLVVSPEAEEMIKSLSAPLLDVFPSLAGASERTSPEYEFGDRVNVTNSKWLLDDDQQSIFDSIMQMEEELIGEVRGVAAGNQVTIAAIPNVRARLARSAQKSAIGRTNRNRPASSGGRRPRSTQSAQIRERFGSASGTGF